MKAPQHGGRGAPMFNMTPMIDVVFLLIIFFLVSSHLASREARMELDLPSADSGESPSPTDRPLIVNVDQDGSIWLSGDRLTPAQLTERLNQQRTQQQDQPQQIAVRVRGDRRTSYGSVQPVLAACAAAGVWKVDFAVHQRNEER